MIFVVFLIPLAVYLLFLGHVNRQPRPVIVSGTWDFIGILFAGSGFLVFGGPAILTSLSESWRMFWLLGESDGRDSIAAQWSFWVSLSALYFLVVVAGVAWALGRQRQYTSIYNVEPETVQETLEEICEDHGLAPIRSGDVFVFGLGLQRSPAPSAGSPEGIQAPHAVPLLVQKTVAPRLDVPPTPREELVGQNAVLEVEAFRALRHVTLRWDPADSPLRGVLEAELDRRLGVAGAPYHETGVWLTLLGYALLGASLCTGFVLLLRLFLTR